MPDHLPDHLHNHLVAAPRAGCQSPVQERPIRTVGERTYPVATLANKSIIKAFDLVDVVCSSVDGLSLREAASATRLSVAATHRILLTLKSVGAVQISNDGIYTLGPRLLGLHEQSVRAHRAVMDLVDGQIKALLTGPNMWARLSVLDAAEVYIFAGADTCTDPRMLGRIGARYEAYCTAPGKVLLSALPARKLDDYVFNAGFIPLTSKTIVVPSHLAEEIKRVRLAGYAVDDGEFFEGVRVVAVPVRVVNGPVVAALSLAGAAADTAVLVSRLTARASELAEAVMRIPGGLRVLHCHDPALPTRPPARDDARVGSP